MHQYVVQNTCYCMLVHTRDGTQRTILIFYCNTVQYLQLVQMKSNFYWNLTVFICYALCVSEVKMSGGTQYCIHL